MVFKSRSQPNFSSKIRVFEEKYIGAEHGANKLILHKTPQLEKEPRLHWWKVSTLTSRQIQDDFKEDIIGWWLNRGVPHQYYMKILTVKFRVPNIRCNVEGESCPNGCCKR